MDIRHDKASLGQGSGLVKNRRLGARKPFKRNGILDKNPVARRKPDSGKESKGNTDYKSTGAGGNKKGKRTENPCRPFLSEGKSSIKPAPVSQAEINKLIGEVDTPEVELQLEDVYFEGEKVKVTDGPFSGFTGVVQEVAQDKHKLKVVVTIFDRQTPLELGFNQVEKE